MPDTPSVTKTASPSSPASSKRQWRFVDAEAFVRHGQIQLVKVDDFRQQDFIAISYVWSQDMKDWRDHLITIGQGHDYEEKIANGSLTISISAHSERLTDQSIVRAHLFFAAVSLQTCIRGKKFFWMDILCINQDDPQEKGYFVSRMGSLYNNADETHAYLTGSSIVASVSSDAFYFPIWERRAWTLQEHILSKNVLFCYVIDGDAIKDIEDMGDHSSGCQTFNLHSLTVNEYQLYSFRDGYGVVFGSGRKVTCYTEKESWTGGLPASSFMTEIQEKGNWSELNKSTGRGALYKTLYKLRHYSPKEVAISTSMVMLGGRQSTLPHDMIYSVLGVLGMEDYNVDYDVSFEEARMGVFEAMKEDILPRTLGTDWGYNLNTGNNDMALPRVLASEPVIGVDLIRPTALAGYNRTVGTQIYSRIERFRVWKDMRKRSSRNSAVVRATLGSTNSRLMIMYCASLFDDPSYSDIPTSEIPEANIHVVIVDGSGISDDEYFSNEVEYDKITNFVEIGECEHLALFTDIEDEGALMKRTALLALECEETISGHLTNKGTALILNASSLSGDFTINTVL